MPMSGVHKNLHGIEKATLRSAFSSHEINVNHMNRWKLAFFITVPLLVAINIFLIFTVIDTSVSYTYLQDSFKHHSQSESALGKLIVKGSKDYTQKDILHLLRQADPNAFIVEEENSIFFSGNTFVFENDRLIEIQ